MLKHMIHRDDIKVLIGDQGYILIDGVSEIP